MKMLIMSEVEEQIRGIHNICEHWGYVVMCFEAYLAIRDVWSVVDPANKNISGGG